jgi:hypothetical protein
LEELQRHRGRYVSAVLTIVIAWLAAGKPQTPCKSLVSFPQWDQLVRQCLLWLGLEDPVQSIFEQLDTDPERELLGRFLVNWYALFSNKPMMLREALSRVNKEMSDGGDGAASNLRHACEEIAGEGEKINTKRLGKWISRKQGRIVTALKLEKSQLTTSSEKWVVTKIDSAKSLTSVMSINDAYSDPMDNDSAPDRDPWDDHEPIADNQAQPTKDPWDE